MMVAVDDSIRSKIGKPKKKTSVKRPARGEKDCRTTDKRIRGRTLVRVARPPVEVMEIDLLGGGAVQRRGRRPRGARVGSV
jgi:hypothetical protein